MFFSQSSRNHLVQWLLGLVPTLPYRFMYMGDDLLGRTANVHSDQTYFNFPAIFTPDDEAPNYVKDKTILHADGNKTTHFYLTDISQHLAGKYGVEVEGTNLIDYIEVIVPAARWQPSNHVYVKAGEAVHLTCMAVQYGSLVASTNLTGSDRAKRMISDERPNPVESLSITIENVSEADAGLYACTSQDSMDSSVSETDMLELTVTAGQADTGTRSSAASFLVVICGLCTLVQHYFAV
ncbi:uncharacterized protein LOC100378947 [Saccoglossus kowalevskii]|uniref:Uncharacterized protein LOC100378947 n=1 Tax=Saccoglossus kowalevskii TaxID=10224 RepID=A0ABM0GJQ5_SACKO|nr:PREDICTED: uncharacterized protein LOC100378947 [Saccoglossus kowalevskii]